VKRAVELGMPAVGLTDHGTMAGAITFIKECRSAGIKPILGVESYQSRDHRCKSNENKEIKNEEGEVVEIIPGQPDRRKGNRHVNIIAKNSTGYANLSTLSQTAFLDGYYYDPRIDLELLNKHRDGLILSSACLSNIVNWNLSIDRYDRALKAASLYQDIFGEDFYLEMMYHGLDKEAKILPDIQKISKDLGVKIIITNDCHYVNKEDAKLHEILMCMSSGKSIRDPKRIKFPYDEFYFKSEEEMKKIFGHLPQSMHNTMEIAEKCDYSDIMFGGMLLPKFSIPAEFNNPREYLHDLAWKGLKKKGLDSSEAHVKRLTLELSDVDLVWKTKGYDFATYFLIVEEIMRFARENEITSGIRGSGYGSLLIHSLEISERDPLSQELLSWERFLGFDKKNFLSDADFGLGEV